MIITLSRKEKLIVIGKILVASAILLFLFQKFQSFDLRKLYTAFTVHIFILVSLLACVNILIQINKWKLVFTEMLGDISEKKIVYSFFVGAATGSFTPGRLGEYFGRSFVIKEYPANEVISASIVDKLANLFVLLFAGIFATIWYLTIKDLFTPNVIYVFSFLSVFLLGIFIFFLLQKKAAANIYKRIEKTAILKKIFIRVQALKKVDRKTVVIQLCFSVFLYGAIALEYGILTATFAHKPLETAFLLAGILTLFVKSFVPSISFGDLGIRESASIFFVTSIGLSAEVGFLSAFSIFLFNILFPSVIGVIILLTTQRK